MRTSTTAILFSLSIHAFCGYSFLSGAAEGIRPDPEPIQISYVKYEAPRIEPKPAAALKPKPVPQILYPPKKAVPVSISSVPVAPKASASAVAPEKPKTTSVVAAKPKTAIDFMTDPQKGKIFFDYFGKLKEKIHLNLRRKYHSVDDSLGVVTLYFVLNPDGSLVKAGVVARESDASAPLQLIALDSLKRSAPFGGFPRDLGNGPVAFSLKIYFDELDS